MARPLWRLTVKSSFCAAHALRHYKGKCERLHGHNYGVEVVVEGERLSEDTELLMDFGDLKSLLKNVLEEFDHAHLNELAPFAKHNPSSENLARYIWKGVAAGLPEGVRMVSATVAEKDIQAATYTELP